MGTSDMSLWDRVLGAWGRRGREVSETPRGAWLELSLETEGGTARIGALSVEGDEYVFRYDPGFAAKPVAEPIFGFPDLTREYRSTRLWPFFEVRMPPVDRPDVREVLARDDIEPTDTLAVLGRLSARAVASPYRFELQRP
jgi:hypothetical protein